MQSVKDRAGALRLRRRQDAWLAARRGAMMLDTRLPAWHTVLDLEGFNIGSGSHCVIGQLAREDMETFYAQVGKALGSGDYTWGVAALMDRPDLMDAGETWPESQAKSNTRRDWAGHHGFDLPRGAGSGYGWAELQEAWIWQIAQRRAVPVAQVVAANWYCHSIYTIPAIVVPWPDGAVPAEVTP